ncbi:hypothetical protein [Dactylosporangium sp. NPDC051484]|uniref:hypothetical protein n=1 Tax=Dactylosporangium sp. NPDC051484 TaxID=3154942 RepID=UPI00344FCEBF
MGADQPANADRSEALGVVLDAMDSTPADAAEALRAVLRQPSYRDAAQTLRTEIASMPSPADAWSVQARRNSTPSRCDPARVTRYGLVQEPYEKGVLFDDPGLCQCSYAAAATGRPVADMSPQDLPSEWFGNIAHPHRAIDDARGYPQTMRTYRRLRWCRAPLRRRSRRRERTTSSGRDLATGRLPRCL